MKTNFTCSLGNFRLAADGDYKMELLVPFSEISNALQSVRVLNKTFDVGIITEGEKYKLNNSMIHAIKIEGDGGVKVTLSIPSKEFKIAPSSLALFKEKPINVIIRKNEDDAQEESGDSEDDEEFEDDEEGV